VNIRRLIHIKIHVVLIVSGIVWTTALATQSIVAEHPQDIVNVLIYIATGLGAAMLGLLTWIFIMLVNDQKKELRQMNADLRQLITNHGLRIHANELAIEALRTRHEVEDQSSRRSGGAE
jgi:hypothetical protein